MKKWKAGVPAYWRAVKLTELASEHMIAVMLGTPILPSVRSVARSSFRDPGQNRSSHLPRQHGRKKNGSSEAINGNKMQIFSYLTAT
ncbi:hypothetical protein AB1N83_010767 [Pleurotus pulmonarius]